MLLILGLAIVGLTMGELPKTPKYFWVFTAHKSTGITVLVLVIARLAWRLYAGTPEPVPGTPTWQERIARITHWMLYALILAMPISGWLYDSASGLRPFRWFGLFDVPKLTPPDEALRGIAHEIHELGFWDWPRWLRARGAASTTTSSSAMPPWYACCRDVHPVSPITAHRRLPPRHPRIRPMSLDFKSPALTAAALVAMMSATPAYAANYVQVPGSTLAFASKYDGEVFTGKFASFTTTLSFDPARLEAAKLDVVIPLAGTSTGNGDRDSTLAGGDFFNVARFAQARYTASKFRALGGNQYAADGTLSLRGISKPVILTLHLDAGAQPVLAGRATGSDWSRCWRRRLGRHRNHP